ncbi:DUF6415 family natural product biosynthesis protein [Streptomyces sp. NPDC094438]|uniref:DUF6415 family natural product biosynthesis protein n=1 Tax=Streptomyces sp. NPDC094438 TaxID=3366061 RepID=UPI0038107DF1
MNVAAAPRASRPEPQQVEQWKPPLPAERLAHIARLMREVRSLDEILDDTGDVLGNQAPPESEFEKITDRLRGDLKRLVSIALAAENTDGQVAALVERAGALRSEDLPGDYRTALGYLRRMAGVTHDLLERLAETGTVKEVA